MSGSSRFNNDQGQRNGEEYVERFLRIPLSPPLKETRKLKVFKKEME
jgi:hypothetical protein